MTTTRKPLPPQIAAALAEADRKPDTTPLLLVAACFLLGWGLGAYRPTGGNP